MEEPPPAVRHRPMRPTHPFEEMQAWSLARRAVGRVASLSAIATADESIASVGGPGAGLEEKAGRREEVERGSRAGPGESLEVGVVVAVAAVGEEVGEAVAETVGEAMFGVAMVGMVAGRVLLLAGGGSLVKALRGAVGLRHRWLGPTRRGGWHTPHCHVWS